MEVFNGDSHSGLKFFIVVIFSGLFRSCTTKRPEMDYDCKYSATRFLALSGFNHIVFVFKYARAVLLTNQ